MSLPLERWIRRLIGPHTVVAAHNPGKDRLTVLEVACANGRRYFGKQVHQERQWIWETRAYRNWVPAMQGRAPELVGTSRSLLTILTSAVSGERPDLHDASAHREAGHVLRLLHESRPSRPGGSVGAHAAKRLESLVTRAPSLFSEEETQFARARIREMAALPPRAVVPCHGDYGRHNWLVDEAGTLRVIDFGDARWQVPAFDLTRLALGPWWNRPELMRSFLAGYGRDLETDERRFIDLHLALNAMMAVRWARFNGRAAQEAVNRERLHQMMAGRAGLADDNLLGRARRRVRHSLGAGQPRDHEVSAGSSS